MSARKASKLSHREASSNPCVRQRCFMARQELYVSGCLWRGVRVSATGCTTTLEPGSVPSPESAEKLGSCELSPGPDILDLSSTGSGLSVVLLGCNLRLVTVVLLSVPLPPTARIPQVEKGVESTPFSGRFFVKWANWHASPCWAITRGRKEVRQPDRRLLGCMSEDVRWRKVAVPDLRVVPRVG